MPSTTAATTKLGAAALCTSLLRFYKSPSNFEVLREVNSGESAVSLRLIEWFVTDAVRNSLKDQSVSSQYSDNLRAYTRRMFDPFRRNARVHVTSGGDSVETTLGQMNFFRWFIESGIWAHVLAHRDTIADTFFRMGRCLRPAKHAPLEQRDYIEAPSTKVLCFD
jgi:hypothetical protein